MTTRSPLDFGAINRAALANFSGLLRERLADGKQVGNEFTALNPTRADSRAGSFTINVAKGVWCDFATGDKGSDPISLFAYLDHGGDQGAAARELASRFGVGPAVVVDAAAPAEPAKKQSRSAWRPIVPAPADAPEPPAAHIKRGRPQRVWRYAAADGSTLGYVYRFGTSAGGKEVLPLVWAVNDQTAQASWRWMAFPVPRPMYYLDRLAARPDRTVLIVEGEKCADVAAAELPDLLVMSWPGGSKATGKVDWAPLTGRDVIIWPDCDAQRVPLPRARKTAGADPDSMPLLPAEQQPGLVAAHAIAATLTGMGCRVSIVSIPPPGAKPPGWDVADAVADGLRGQELAAYIAARAQPYGTTTPPRASCSDDTDWRDGLIFKHRGTLEDCRENVYLILSRHPAWAGRIGYNEFNTRIEKLDHTPTGRPSGEWTTDDDFSLGLWLAQEVGLLIRGEGTLAAGVAMTAGQNRFHPVRDWLESLPAHDGIERLDHWLSDCLGAAESTYVRWVGRWTLIALVARVMQPGCPAHHMTILEGPQGRGKSTALRVLGGEWFCDTPFHIGDRDAYMVISGAWLYEISELDSMNRAEASATKSFCTSQVDRYREPYARRPVDRPRQVIFIGTTNSREYLKDQTGNRRYWPVRVGQIDLEKLREWRMQLFAEALQRYRAGDRWYPTRDEERQYIRPEQEERELIDPWLQTIDEWLDEAGNIQCREFTVRDILVGALKVSVDKVDGNRSMATRVGNVMHRLGWIKRRRPDGRREWYYQRPAAEVHRDDDGDAA